MVQFYKVEIYDTRLKLFLNTPNSGDREDLWKWLEIQKLKAIVGARSMAGFRTGALRRSISAKHLGNATGQYLTIGSILPYALMHHEGTKPHIITPNDGKILHFRSGTRSIFTTMVRHPGTKPNHYLSRQLRHFRG